MRQTDPIKPSGEELIDYIRERLIVNEEPYVPGAWENFNRDDRNSKKPVYLKKRLMSAAAVLLIGAGLYLFNGNTGSNHTVQVTKARNIKGTGPSDVLKTGKEVADTAVHEVTANITYLTGRTTSILHSSDPVIPPANGAVISGVDLIPGMALQDPGIMPAVQADINSLGAALAAVSGIPAGETPATRDAGPESRKIPFQDFLAAEMQKAWPEDTLRSEGTNGRKWDMGLVVSPSYGANKKMTMGYGLSMGYALSNTISLNSGISYNEMAASKSFVQPQSMTLLNDKILESAEAKYTGIDIPLEIRYYLHKNIYVNAGISTFYVLDQNRNNTYTESKLVERTVRTTEGVDEVRTFIENQKTTEKVQGSEIGDDKYLGLYNFSLGYKQKISKNKKLSIEPFMKVPMKERTKESLHLIGTGIRFRIGI